MDNVLKTPITVGIGEILWDVLPDGKKLGGAPANFAYHTSQFGLNGIAVSAVGKDNLGDEIRELLEARRLESHLQVNDHPTGEVDVLLDEKGVPTYDIKTDVAWDYIRYDEYLKKLAPDVTAVCFGTLAQRNDVSKAAIKSFVEAVGTNVDGQVYKVFDINLRQDFYTVDTIKESMTLCNIMKINDDELILIKSLLGIEARTGEQLCRKLMSGYDIDMMILTCGVDGSYVFVPGEMYYQPTPVVEVVDTVGAGDSFTASFIASLIRGLSVKDAHKLAVDVSAFVCSRQGAMPNLPEHFL